MRIEDYIKENSRVCITGHVSPDGDCVGSTLALYSYLQKVLPQLTVDLYLEPPTDKLAFLHNFDKIDSGYPKQDPYDLVICLDSASRERIGKSADYFKQAGTTLNIDHHISNQGYADINIMDPDASSCCEVLYGLLDPDRIDQDIAICLYTGILYDTGVFKYSCTSSKTMEIVAKLMKFDIPAQYIIDESFYAKTYDEHRIYGYAILKSCLAYDGKVIYSSITKAEMRRFGVTKTELEGIVSQLRLTKGVECSVFIYDLDDGNCKASLRSGEYLDVNKVASVFGGGGHMRAAGCTVKGPIEKGLERLLEEVGNYI